MMVDGEVEDMTKDPTEVTAEVKTEVPDAITTKEAGIPVLDVVGGVTAVRPA